ncbi:MAG TPA: phosphate ABC transporter substrate-binding protein PstS [Trebonia sp.]
MVAWRRGSARWRVRTVLPRAGIAAAMVGLVAACGAGAGAPGAAGAPAGLVSAPGGTISETGSSLLYPLMHTWAGAYHKQVPGVTVATVSSSSGTGIAAASAGTSDLGASDAFLSTGDLVENPTLLNIALAVSAQAVIYNLPGASGHVRLDGAVLAEIYDGTVTMWDDPAIAAINPGTSLPAIKIVPVRRSDSSGDTFLFTSYLSTGSQSPADQAWNSKIGYGTTVAWPAVPGELAEAGSVNLLHTCAATAGCVSYEGISYLAQARAAGLGEAELANDAGAYTLPTQAAIKASLNTFVSLTPPSEAISMINGPAAGGYPIVNYEYAIVSTRQPSAARASAIRSFLTWVLTTGNQPAYVDTVGFQPLPGALVTLGKQQIGQIGA